MNPEMMAALLAAVLGQPQQSQMQMGMEPQLQLTQNLPQYIPGFNEPKGRRAPSYYSPPRRQPSRQYNNYPDLRQYAPGTTNVPKKRMY